MGVVSVEGSVRIQCCNTLTDISGFQSLNSVRGSVVVYYNRGLTGISGFASLGSIEGSLVISQNRNLVRISGFSSLKTIRNHLAIERNTALVNLDGLKGLSLIRGAEISLGHALIVTYNTELPSLAGLSGLTNISYGTVHLEGNSALCYAGYPQWQEGAWPPRPLADDESEGAGQDRGIDWRTRLSGVESWQYTWGVEGGGYPTLLIQNNAPIGTCSEL